MKMMNKINVKIKLIYRVLFTFVFLLIIVLAPFSLIVRSFNIESDTFLNISSIFILLSIIPIYYWFSLPRVIRLEDKVIIISDFFRIKKQISINEIVDLKYIKTPSKECGGRTSNGEVLMITTKKEKFV